jgi:hypothetical protein
LDRKRRVLTVAKECLTVVTVTKTSSVGYADSLAIEARVPELQRLLRQKSLTLRSH